MRQNRTSTLTVSSRLFGALALHVLCCTANAEPSTAPTLVRNTGAVTAATPERDPTVRRSWRASVAVDLLLGARPGDEAALELVPPTRVPVLLDDVRVTPETGRGIWRFRLVEPHAGSVVMTMERGVLGGVIRSDASLFRIRTADDGSFVLQEIDELLFPPCGIGVAQAVAGGVAGGAGAGTGCQDDGSVIDVFVAYTALARAAAGGTGAIHAEINLAVANANASYANSLVATQLNLVGTTEVSYNEAGTYQDHLYRLTDPGDGFMDDLHTLRDQAHADMVALLVDDGEYCGIAWLMTQNSPAFDAWAFSITTWYCAAGNLTFPHELGHNMGCCHAAGDGGGCLDGGLFSYSVGHRFFGNSGTQWRTVMAYAPGVRIPRFSNPSVVYDGQPTGVAVGLAGEAHNALTINQTSVTVASFRALGVDCNGNGVCDSTDIFSGTSEDCNGNIYPDECDIAGGTSFDVNGNGVPDECKPPVNDDCQNAVAIAEGEFSFNTTSATTDGFETPCAGSTLWSFSDDLWYLYTPTCTGIATFTTCGDSDFDSRVAVYFAGPCPPATPLACSDNAPGCGQASEVHTVVVQGFPYLVRVGGTLQAGAGILTVACAPFCGNGQIEGGENCTSCPQDVPCPGGTTCDKGQCVTACAWDIDSDGSVGITDFLELLAQWGTVPGGPPDFDGDGTVGITDFLELLAHWGSCP